MAKPIDRQSTTPFHLKLFYRVDNFHHLSDFAIASSPSGRASGPNAIHTHSPPPAPASGARLPPHLEIYTWQSCSLRELTQLLTLAMPSLLPDPPVGTRLCYRLIYPDTKAAAMSMGSGADVKGRYLSKDIGSVIVGPRDSRDNQEEHHDDGQAGSGSGPRGALRLQGSDADKTLQEMRFVIGDYVDCAVLPPLEDGSVAPPLTAGRGAIGGSGPGGVGGGMRAFRDTPGFGGGRAGRGGRDRGFPAGDWKRRERLPEGGGRGYGRRGWAPY